MLLDGCQELKDEEKGTTYLDCREDKEVIYMRHPDQVKKQLFDLERKMKADQNYFFYNNKIMPWIQVSAYRAAIKQCAGTDLKENPAYI